MYHHRGLVREPSVYPIRLPPLAKPTPGPSTNILTATAPNSPEPLDSDGATTPRRRNSAVGDGLGSAGSLAEVLDVKHLYEVIFITYMYLVLAD